MLREDRLGVLAISFSGKSRLYSQIRSPVAALSAWILLAKLKRKSTPSCTIGVVSVAPGVIDQVQATWVVPHFELCSISQASKTATISVTDQSRSVTPAAIA